MSYAVFLSSTCPSAANLATTASIFLYGQLKAGYKKGLRSNLADINIGIIIVNIRAYLLSSGEYASAW
jgi:hypothetical protein